MNQLIKRIRELEKRVRRFESWEPPENPPPGPHDHAGDTLLPAEVIVGDIVFANSWRITETDHGLALLDEQGNIVIEWRRA